MLKAYLTHIVLLLGLRHPGCGLPHHWPPLLAVIVLASLSAAVRWAVFYDAALFARLLELFIIALAMFFWLILLAQLSPRFSAAFALVSIGADAIGVLLLTLDLYGDLARAALLFLKSIALARIAAVLYLRARVERRE